MYTSGICQEEDPYEVQNVQSVIWNHIFEYVTFCKGEGVKTASTKLDQK